VGAGAGIYATRKKILGLHGWGLKVYTKRNGEVSVHHKHHGIKGYHSPDVSHRSSYVRHPRGELKPEYIYNQEKQRWEYEGYGG
jgi:hypothetical protein